MKIPEPNRLLHESNSQLERALLGAGAMPPSSAQTRTKTLAALGLAAGSATLLDGRSGCGVADDGRQVDLDQAGAGRVAGGRGRGSHRLLHCQAPARARGGACRGIGRGHDGGAGGAGGRSGADPRAGRPGSRAAGAGQRRRAWRARPAGRAPAQLPARASGAGVRGAAHRRAGEDRPHSRGTPARAGVPAASSEQRARDPRAHASRRGGICFVPGRARLRRPCWCRRLPSRCPRVAAPPIRSVTTGHAPPIWGGSRPRRPTRMCWPTGWGRPRQRSTRRSPRPGTSCSTAMHSTQAIYFPVGMDQAEIRDTFHNNDIRTEGFGYAMMIAVQLDKRTEFDRMWKYVKSTLSYPMTDPNGGYFQSSCDSVAPTGPVSCNDPFGHAQFVTALLFARDRWDPGHTRLRSGRRRAAGRDASQGRPQRRHRQRRHQHVRHGHRAPLRRARSAGRRRVESVGGDAGVLRAVGAGDEGSVLDARRDGCARLLETLRAPDHGPVSDRANFDGAPVENWDTFYSSRSVRRSTWRSTGSGSRASRGRLKTPTAC